MKFKQAIEKSSYGLLVGQRPKKMLTELRHVFFFDGLCGSI